MKYFNNQKGVAHLILLVLLVLGLGAGLYLISQTQTFNPQAANSSIVFKSTAGQVITSTTSPTVKIELTSTLGPPNSISAPVSGKGSGKKNTSTTSYRITEGSPAEFSRNKNTGWVPYTQIPTVISYTFKNIAPGNKFIWVEFKGLNGKTDRQNAKITLLAQTPLPRPSATPSQSPQRTSYLVKPYLVYPADKSVYPEYEVAVKKYLVELQNWYKQKVGATFVTRPLVVVKSSYNYNTMRCDPNPNDAIPPSQVCLNDPKKMDGNWGTYMNKAIHNGTEQWDAKTATLVFSAGGGGYAGADKYPNDTGWAITGDWVLEPLSGKANTWGIPCKYSAGWQCAGNVPKGTPAHELGHAFGLGHPDPNLYPGNGISIMKWHGDYPTVGFLPYEVEYLRNSPFFK